MTEVHASFGGKRGVIWSLLASFLIPTLMVAAYLFLMYTSETDATGKAWEGVGLAMAFLLYWLFRTLTESAALSRAFAVGDVDRVLELARKHLARRTRAAGKAPFYIYSALALELRGEWTAALAAEAKAKPTTTSWRVMAAGARIAALVETGEVAAARSALDREIEPCAGQLDHRRDAQAVILANLARGQVLCAEHKPKAAMQALQRVLDDVRAGNGTRGIAYFYAAKCADGEGDLARSRTLRARVAELAPTAWVARQNPPVSANPT